MSLVTDILDRLTGLAVVKVQLDMTATEVRRMGDWLLDHEKRLIRLESSSQPGPSAAPQQPRLPRSSG
jgi:hypothetical protein